MSGVPRRRIKFFHYLDKQLRQGDTFILMTRYEIMAELRAFFSEKNSNLFPSIGIPLLKKLENQYEASQAKTKNLHKHKKENESECVTRLLRTNANRIKDTFRMILIDEAHFLKNLTSFWGIGTALLGMASERSCPLSGTPYNNGPQDMATLMTFIEPSLESAKCKW